MDAAGRRLAILALTALAACSGEVTPLPTGAQVTCASDGDCPSGFFCSLALGGRCVERGGADQTAPSLVGTPTVSPAVARGGTPVTITFEVSEDLSLDPDVRVSGAAAPLGRPSRAGRVYTLEFPASAALGAGTKTIVATLVDLSGNEAASVLLGQLTLDLAQPGVVTTSFPPFARSGTDFSGTVTFDEPLGRPPSLAVAGGPALAASAGPGANQWTFSRRLDGSEPAGPVSLLLSAADVAGNLLETTFSGASTFDFTAPTVAETTIGTPSVRQGDTFLASVRFSEALGGPPAFALAPAGGGAPLPVAVSAVDAATWSLSLDVAPGAADGGYTLTLASAADRAGNPAARQGLGAVAFDSTAPRIQALAPSLPGRLYRAGQVVQVGFALDEPPAAAPEVRLEVLPDPLPFTCTPAGLAYTCTSDVALTASLPEGAASVSVTAIDAAGNVGSATTAIVLDFTPPGLASAPASRYLGAPATLGVPVTAVGTASSWEVALLTDEPLAGPPALTAIAPGGATSRPLALTASNAPVNTSFTFTLPASPTAFAAGTWSVRWSATDQAGNVHAAPQEIATVAVDGTAPAAPEPGTAAAPQLTWTRAPWGTDRSATPVFELAATPAALGADAAVLVAWDGASAGAREVGRAAVGGAGALVALASDPAELYASTLDRAGNESPRTRVVDVIWTAALAGKVPGSTFENPHRLETRARSLGALAQLDAVQVAGAALGVRGDGQVVTTAAAALYRPVAGVTDPGARIFYSLGADPGRGVVVLQGGQLLDASSPGDTWEWNGSAWRQVFPSDPEGDGNAPRSLLGSLVFDPVRGGLLAYASDGLWLWNGTSWRNLGPVPAAGGSIAWDARRAVLVLFDGFGRTFEWAGSTWTNVTPAASPPARSFTPMFFDTVAGQVCLYGGRTNAGVDLADLWCWSGAAWSSVAMAGAGPFARRDHAFAWDAANGELFVQSGRSAVDVTPEGRTWVLRRVGGTPTWFDATPASGLLGLRQHAATFDPASGRVIMFGDLTVTPAALRAWDGAAYASLSPGDPEGDRHPTFLFRTSNPVYVPARGRVVFAQAGATLETWEWDRVSWSRRAVGGGPTASQGGLSSGWFGANLLTFGGNSLNVARGDTWSWNGTTWTLLEAGLVHPAAANDERFRADAGLATDPATGRLFRFGGYDSYFTTAAFWTCPVDVWEWTGATWTKRAGEPWADPEGDGTPTQGTFLVDPPCNARERVIWSPVLQTLLLYDTTSIWEWRQATTSWKKHVMGGGTPSNFQAFFWDTSLGLPVVVHRLGAFAVDLVADRYVPLPQANPYGPSLPGGGTFAFDTGLGVAVGVEALPWVWESTAKGQPAHLFSVDASRAGGPDPAGCVAGAACPIQQIAVTWSGGGSAPTGDGATLQAWTGAWQDVATNGSTAAAPSEMTYTWSSASTIPAASLFHGAARELTFALVPNGVSTSAGAATAGTDAVAVTIRYRRP